MHRTLIVVGASAGGIEPLQAMLSALPDRLPASVLVTQHLAAHAPSALPHILSRTSRLPVAVATDGARLTPGQVLVAPPDHHLLVGQNVARLTRGPRENGYRPAIDPLFRTAARWWGRRVIGVVLSGALDDGAAGLVAVRVRGGATVVQEPADAAYPSMPMAALAHVPESVVTTRADLAGTLIRLLAEELPDAPSVGAPLERLLPEDQTLDEAPPLDARDDRDGVSSGLTCPDCHGALWEVVDGRLVRYRCRVGHAYSPESLAALQSAGVEDALWAAYRSLEESANMSARIAARMAERGLKAAAAQFEGKREAELSRARLIRHALEVSAGNPGPPAPTEAR